MLYKPQGVTWLLMDWNSFNLWCIIFKVYEDDWCSSDLHQIEEKMNKTIEFFSIIYKYLLPLK